MYLVVSSLCYHFHITSFLDTRLLNHILLTISSYSYPAFAICKHPDRSLRRRHHNALEGWQQHSTIDKCSLCWGNNKSACGSDPYNRDGNENQQWVANVQTHLPNFCPSCSDNRRTSGETLLSVPMMLEQFRLLRIGWSDDNPLDISNADISSMCLDGLNADTQYTQDTRGGPWNLAEGNLRWNLRQYQRKWESYIQVKKRYRYEQERGPDWEQYSYRP